MTIQLSSGCFNIHQTRPENWLLYAFPIYGFVDQDQVFKYWVKNDDWHEWKEVRKYSPFLEQQYFQLCDPLTHKVESISSFFGGNFLDFLKETFDYVSIYKLKHLQQIDPPIRKWDESTKISL